MPSQQNSSDFAFGGYWNQSASQFSASSARYEEADDAPRTALSYSFVLPEPPFGDRDACENMPSTQPSLSSPSGTVSTVTVPPVQTISTRHQQPSLHQFPATGSIQTDTTYEQSTQQPTKARNPMPRAPNFTPSDWEKHHDEIKRLWVDENKTLPETMKVMAKTFEFEPSIEQYKKQLKKWNWSKYLPTKEAFWMENKAAKRKHEEKKDTVFDYRGQTYTQQSIQQRLQRKKIRQDETVASADAPTPSGITYTTPRDDPTSPLYIASPRMSTQPLRRIPASTTSIAQASHKPNLLRDGRSEADIEAVHQEAQSLERRSMIEDAEKKFREALIGFESLYSATHETTTAVAYHLASFYASCGRMKDADIIFDWMTGKYIQRYGHKGLETLEHLLNVVEMFCNWSRIKDSPKIVLLFQRIGLFYESNGIWNDAEPWFEQALLACYRSLGEGSSSAKRLEAALEKQRLPM